MFKVRDYLDKENVCQTCSILIYFHISFTAFFFFFRVIKPHFSICLQIFCIFVELQNVIQSAGMCDYWTLEHMLCGFRSLTALAYCVSVLETQTVT